jgi:hypothetical protein
MHRDQDPIHAAVRRARMRLTAQEALAQGLVAASLGVGGAILILLAGTQLLDWRWAAMLLGAGLLFGAWQVRRRVPAPYRVAQLVDQRLRLDDALSTAWYFGETAEARPDPELVRCQRAMAERLTERIDLRSALPFTLPRSAFLLAGLLVAAGSLFALRYGIEERLDLRAPLLRVVFDAFGGQYQTASTKPPQGRPLAPEAEGATPEGVSAEDRRYDDEQQLDAAPDKVFETIDIPDVNNDRLGAEERPAKGARAGEAGAEGEPGEGEAGGERGETQAADGLTAETDSGSSAKNGDEDSGGKQAPGSAGEDSGLAQKFREALQNLMSKLRPPSGGSQGQNSKASSKSGSQSPMQTASAKDGGKQGQGAQQGEKGEGQDGEPGESQEGESAEGASKGRSTESASSQTPGSGMGKQDGAKDARLAEQLEAMGKISEILGKRSQNVTGETTLEVQSSKAGIRTPYSPSTRAHGQAGGEIHRDEVPEALQHYVQQYFEQVHRPGQK